MVAFWGPVPNVDYTAVYAAIISTIALIWNIADALLGKMVRIKVRAGMSIQFVQVPGIGTGPASPVVNVSITNLSLFDVFIDKPLLELPEEIDGHKRYGICSFGNTTQYPARIGPRERICLNVEARAMIGLLEKCKNRNGAIRFSVEDTSGKKFYSNRIAISRILDLASMNFEQ